MENKINYTNKLLMSFGSVFLVFAIIVWFLVSSNINKLFLRQLNYEIPNIFSVSNATALLEQDFATVNQNIDLIMENLGENMNLAYICIMDNDKNPVYYKISKKIKGRYNADVAARLERLKGLKLTSTYSLLSGTEIREVLTTIGSPPIGFLRMGYFWSGIVSKARVLKIGLFVVMALILIIIMVVIIYVNSQFNSILNDILIDEKKRVIEKTKKNIYHEINLKQEEELKRKMLTDLTQKEIFIILDIIKNISTDLEVTSVCKFIIDGLLKLFNCKEVMLYRHDLTQENLLYGIYGYNVAGYIESKVASEQHVVVGEGEIGLTALHNNVVIGDIPRPGYLLTNALYKNDKLLGAFIVENKNANKGFNKHDKLLARIISPIIANLLDYSFYFTFGKE